MVSIHLHAMLLVTHLQRYACVMMASSRFHGIAKTLMEMGIVVGKKMMTGRHHGHVAACDRIFVHRSGTIASTHRKKLCRSLGACFLADLFVGTGIFVGREGRDVAIITNPLVAVGSSTTIPTLLVTRWLSWSGACHSHAIAIGSMHQWGLHQVTRGQMVLLLLLWMESKGRRSSSGVSPKLLPVVKKRGSMAERSRRNGTTWSGWRKPVMIRSMWWWRRRSIIETVAR
mmetsp:Transcript_17916/g.39074  ORF Transcript_17916/g.39074 Transcript_17916/m.39074 type:complete len:229 (-) Transcript_17916:221-907(-)